MKRMVKASGEESSISAQIVDTLSDLLGGLWREDETYYGNTLLMFNRLFIHGEAVREIIPECKQALKASGLWRYVSSIDSFWSDGRSDESNRIAVTLKKKLDSSTDNNFYQNSEFIDYGINDGEGYIQTYKDYEREYNSDSSLKKDFDSVDEYIQSMLDEGVIKRFNDVSDEEYTNYFF